MSSPGGNVNFEKTSKTAGLAGRFLTCLKGKWCQQTVPNNLEKQLKTLESRLQQLADYIDQQQHLIDILIDLGDETQSGFWIPNEKGPHHF